MLTTQPPTQAYNFSSTSIEDCKDRFSFFLLFSLALFSAVPALSGALDLTADCALRKATPSIIRTPKRSSPSVGVENSSHSGCASNTLQSVLSKVSFCGRETFGSLSLHGELQKTRADCSWQNEVHYWIIGITAGEENKKKSRLAWPAVLHACLHL